MLLDGLKEIFKDALHGNILGIILIGTIILMFCLISFAVYMGVTNLEYYKFCQENEYEKLSGVFNIDIENDIKYVECCREYLNEDKTELIEDCKLLEYGDN